MRTLFFSLCVGIFLVDTVCSLNRAFMDVMTGDGHAAAWPLVTAAAYFVAVLITWFTSARLGGRVTAGSVAATVFAAEAIGYMVYLATVPVHHFGTAATGPQGVIEETYPRRGKHTYRMNSLGFRGPEWSVTKPPGVVRGAVIGDSMVFGSGVDDGETIDAALAARLRRTHADRPVEILNLGVTGTNLPGYVELYRAATQRLAPDFVVLFLFLPNDFGELEQPSAADRVGPYSFLAFLFGTNNNVYTLYALRAARSDESSLAFLAHHIQTIEGIRRSLASAPLFVFLYNDEDARWSQTVRAQLGEGAEVVNHARLPDEDFIPGDGHPTPAGNRHFAEIIGAAIDRSPPQPLSSRAASTVVRF